jgi:hypothetical protein
MFAGGPDYKECLEASLRRRGVQARLYCYFWATTMVFTVAVTPSTTSTTTI